MTSGSAGPRPAAAPASGSMTMASGSQTSAVTPPVVAGCSRTLTPCLAASLATTNRPMFLETVASIGGGFSSRQLACAIISGFMPTP